MWVQCALASSPDIDSRVQSGRICVTDAGNGLVYMRGVSNGGERPGLPRPVRMIRTASERALGHLLPFSISWGHGSVAYFADRPADRLIVFVHGFGGKAVGTWAGMEALLAEPEAAGADVLFYGYGSLAAPARNSAALFYNFLSAAAEVKSPWKNALFRAGASMTRDYRDIMVVAHSLGAVVVRRALLDAIADGDCWTTRTRILLFGPAHMGTRLTELRKMLKSGIGSILSDIFAFAQVRMPVLDDLAQGSPFLAELLDESGAAIARGIVQPVRAEGVVFGERENVVDTTPFCSDPRSVVWEGHDHRTICRAPQTVHEVLRHL